MADDKPVEFVDTVVFDGIWGGMRWSDGYRLMHFEAAEPNTKKAATSMVAGWEESLGCQPADWDAATLTFNHSGDGPNNPDAALSPFQQDSLRLVMDAGRRLDDARMASGAKSAGSDERVELAAASAACEEAMAKALRAFIGVKGADLLIDKWRYPGG